MLNKKHISTLAASAMCLVIAGVSHAQNRTIEEVTVTAAKKEQTLQEIPVAVSVISGDAIEKAQILDLSDLQSIVPSLRINTLQNSANTNFIIRGFGNGANNPGIEPSVGVFIDGVYRSLEELRSWWKWRRAMLPSSSSKKGSHLGPFPLSRAESS